MKDCSGENLIMQDLINKKDYDYISWYLKMPREHLEKFGYDNEFFGACHSKDGVLIPDDGDVYYADSKVVSYEEFSNKERGVESGLTVVVIE